MILLLNATAMDATVLEPIRGKKEKQKGKSIYMPTLSEQLLNNVYQARRLQDDLDHQTRYKFISDEKNASDKLALSSFDQIFMADTLQNLLDKKITDRAYRSYFVTTTFYGDGEIPVTKKLDYVWEHYFTFYRHLVSNLINHPKRKRYLHPISADFIDFPKNKRGLPLDQTLMPHVHSIYLVDEVIADLFEPMYLQGLDRVLKHQKLNRLSTCKVEKIQEYRQTSGSHQLYNTIKYCSKYVRPKMKSKQFTDSYNPLNLCQFLPLPNSDFTKREKPNEQSLPSLLFDN